MNCFHGVLVALDMNIALNACKNMHCVLIIKIMVDKFQNEYKLEGPQYLENIDNEDYAIFTAYLPKKIRKSYQNTKAKAAFAFTTKKFSIFQKIKFTF